MSLALSEKAFLYPFVWFQAALSMLACFRIFRGSLPIHFKRARLQDAVTKLRESLSSLTSGDDHDDHGHDRDHEMSEYNDTLPVVLSVVALVWLVSFWILTTAWVCPLKLFLPPVLTLDIEEVNQLMSAVSSCQLCVHVVIFHPAQSNRCQPVSTEVLHHSASKDLLVVGLHGMPRVPSCLQVARPERRKQPLRRPCLTKGAGRVQERIKLKQSWDFGFIIYIVYRFIMYCFMMLV